MTAPICQTTEASTSREQSRSMRNGVLLHPGTARDGRCLILPHPRTQVPTYYLYSENAPKPSSASSDTSKGELFELSTLKDTKYDRSWMISGVNEVISSGQLEILSRVDVRFLVTSLLYSVLVDSKFRSLEDIFEQIALGLHGKRKEEMIDSIVALKSDLGEGEGGDGKGSVQQEWTDIVTFGNLPIVKDALQEVADVQDLPNGEQAYRISTSKVFPILDARHARLSQQSTFAASPNILGRSFERRWPLESDPSPYLVAGMEESADCKEAKELRRKIAAEIIATNLPPQLAAEYFTHLGFALEK
ncbi:uncharacterized protein UHOD_01005 [Ustilago sp. UG-2017b]|nr:uncharacterized protein UHOD_01005 [Ustilago sp. UG-2017b]